jgi:hypothetical protein
MLWWRVVRICLLCSIVYDWIRLIQFCEAEAKLCEKPFSLLSKFLFTSSLNDSTDLSKNNFLVLNVYKEEIDLHTKVQPWVV